MYRNELRNRTRCSQHGASASVVTNR